MVKNKHFSKFKIQSCKSFRNPNIKKKLFNVSTYIKENLFPYEEKLLDEVDNFMFMPTHISRQAGHWSSPELK